MSRTRAAVASGSPRAHTSCRRRLAQLARPAPHGVSATRRASSPRWSRTGENLVWKADFTARATPIVFDGRVCASGRGGTGLDAPGARGLLRRGHGQEALGASLQGLQHDRALHARGLGRAGAATPRPATSSPRTWTGSSSASTATGKTVWERRLGEEFGRGSGLRRPDAHPARGRGPRGRGRRGRGLGRHRAAAPALHGLRQEDGRGALGLDAGAGPLRRREQPGEPDRGRDRRRAARASAAAPTDGSTRCEARTGEPVWRFQVSVRGLNSPPARGRATSCTPPTARRTWTAGAWGASSPSTARARATSRRRASSGARAACRRLRRAHGERTAASTSWTTPRTSTPSTRRRASLLWSAQPRARSGRAAPVLADGKLYLTEQNGKVLIVEPGPTGAKTLQRGRASRCPRVGPPRSGARWPSRTAASTSRPRKASTASAGRARRSRPDGKPAAAPRSRRPPPDAKAARLLIVPARGDRARRASRWPSRPGRSTTRAASCARRRRRGASTA